MKTYQEELSYYKWQVKNYIPQNQFEEKEQIGRQKIQSLEAKDCRFKVLSGTSIVSAECYDVIVEIEGLDALIIGEIKVRNAYRNTFKDWLLETKKIKELNLLCEKLNKKRKNKKKFIPALINVTAKDNKICIYHILKENPREEKTQFCKRDNYSNSAKIEKQVQFFNDNHLIFQFQI